MATTWLITREAEDAQAERDACIARGDGAVIVPCVETKLLRWPFSPSLRQRGEGRGEGLTFFTSRRSVAAWISADRPALETVAAMSPATANALQHAGVTPAITSENGARALAEKVREWWTAHGRPSLTISYPTSDAGLHAPEQAEAMTVLEQLGSVDRRVVYTVDAPANLRAALERAARSDWSISFASPSAVQHFFAANAVIETAPRQVACLGASTERTWNAARPASWPSSRAVPHTEKVEP